MLACEKAGVVAVGIGARAGTREVEHLVDRTGARMLVTDPRRRTGAGRRRRPTRRAGARRDELWFLNSTSGTTGLPKIVMHDQARWFAFHDFARPHRASSDPTTSSSARFPRRSASGCGPRTSRRRSWARRASCARASTPKRCSPRSSATACTVLAAVSTQFVMLLNSPAIEAHDLSSLRDPVHRRRDGALRAGPRVRGAHRRDGAPVLRQQRDRRAVGDHARRPARAAAADRGPGDPRDAGAPARSRHRRRHHGTRRSGSARGQGPDVVPRLLGRPEPPTSGSSPPTAGCAWATSRPSTPTAT